MKKRVTTPSMQMEDDKVNIGLTKGEAIVLFAFLSRFNGKDDNGDLFDDQSEQRVLWDIEATLEKTLVEPFRQDYLDILKQARENVRDDE